MLCASAAGELRAVDDAITIEVRVRGVDGHAECFPGGDVEHPGDRYAESALHVDECGVRARPEVAVGVVLAERHLEQFDAETL